MTNTAASPFKYSGNCLVLMNVHPARLSKIGARARWAELEEAQPVQEDPETILHGSFA